MAPASKAQQKAVAKYENANYDKVLLRMPKGGKNVIKQAADKNGISSINGYITTAVNEKLIKDGFEPIAKKLNVEEEQA